MPHLHRISSADLRSMARQATSMHLNGGTPLNDAIVKVASDFEHPLTSEHVRRVCEMTYHDTFERSFRGGGDSRVVNFDPPEAEKIANAIRATRVQSFRDKLAAAPAGTEGHDKTASAAPEYQVPAAPNAFATTVADPEAHREAEILEAKSILKTAQGDVNEAIKALEVELGSAKHAESLAYMELGQQVRQAVIDGTEPEMVLSVCEHFMKEASVPEHIAVDIVTALASDMLEAGIDLSEKRAGLDNVIPNSKHPIQVRVIKVADFRAKKFATEIALGDLRHDAARVEQELQDALFQ